jgi:hypothetical protein
MVWVLRDAGVIVKLGTTYTILCTYNNDRNSCSALYVYPERRLLYGIW